MIDASALPDVAKLHPELKDPYERMYAGHLLAREGALAQIFGAPGDLLTPENPKLAAKWPGGGIFEIPPSGDRHGFTYVTHGLSQPRSSAEFTPRAGDEPSGFGLEYVISTPKRSDDWAPDFLIDNAAYLLFDENPRPVLPGQRASANALAKRSGSETLSALIAVASPEYDGDIRLPGGFCQLIHLVGISRAELDAANALGRSERGTHVLLRTLFRYGIGTQTDAKRKCITTLPDFERIWREELAEVDKDAGP